MVSTDPTEDEDSDQMRVRLSQRELEQVYQAVSNDMEKEIALRLMGEAGLRSAEVTDVTMEHVEPMEVEESRFKLVVPNGKGDKRRETVISSALRDKMQAYSQAHATGSEPIVDRTTRTLQNWVTDVREQQNGEGWEYVSTHDLRRSWANELLESGTSVPVVMQLGGWEDYETFRDHYLDTLSDASIAEQTAGFFA